MTVNKILEDRVYSRRAENQRTKTKTVSGRPHKVADRLATSIFTDKVKAKATSFILNTRFYLYSS